MSMNRVLTLAAILVVAIAIVHLSRPQRQWKQPRVLVEAIARAHLSHETSSVDWTEYFRSACPHMALVGSDELADYSIYATWLPSPPMETGSWTVRVERRDYAKIYQDSGGKSPDSIKLLRESCRAIRSDVEEWGEFGRERPPKVASVGRYALSYHPTNYNQALLLDTKTGAVWELVQDNYPVLGKKIDYRKFNRISVDGLYTSFDEREATRGSIDRTQQPEVKKKAEREMWERSWQEERQRENALDEK